MKIVMAIYHFSAKIISRASGSSVLASAAYRSASRLYDHRLNRHHDFTSKGGVIHSEVMTPDGVPDELRERERLWNAVETAEKRKDAQLAREVEFAIPRELDQAQAIELAREFVRQEFVAGGMIADLNIHWDIGEDGQPKPHAHVILTMRRVDEHGFGGKVRDWNRTDLLEHWREAWGVHVNERLAQLGIELRIDHRSLADQGIDLEPQNKIGRAARSRAEEGLEADRLDDHREIARENGDRIIKNPTIALDAITRQQATFTQRNLAMFVHRHSDGLDQFNAVMSAIQSSPELVRLGQDGRDEGRFTSREMIAVEEQLHRAAKLMADRERHRISERSIAGALERAELEGLVLSREQRSAFAHVAEARDLGIVVGYAGAGKSALLGVAREAWEEFGFRVTGIALSGIAAENLEAGSSIASRTVASLEHQWGQGREVLSAQDVLVIDEAGMIGSRQLERVLSEAERHGAKVVLIGDPEQLQAIEAGAAFRSLIEREPHVEISEVRRQREGWQQQATRELATGRTGEALDAYREHGMVHAADSRDQARSALIEGWDRDRTLVPDKSGIILTHTNDEVRALNELARGRLREHGELGADVSIQVERGRRNFAAGDRVMFLKNDRGLGVKNGSLGIVEHVSRARMEVRLDAGRNVAFDFKDYARLDHGYAATIHKAQGVTVDQVHVLATPGLDRHAAYVALSRHRELVVLHYGRDDFVDDFSCPTSCRVTAPRTWRAIMGAKTGRQNVLRSMSRTGPAASSRNSVQTQRCGSRSLPVRLARRWGPSCNRPSVGMPVASSTLPKWKNSTSRSCRIRSRPANAPWLRSMLFSPMDHATWRRPWRAILHWPRTPPSAAHGPPFAPCRSKRRSGPLRSYAPTVSWHAGRIWSASVSASTNAAIGRASVKRATRWAIWRKAFTGIRNWSRSCAIAGANSASPWIWAGALDTAFSIIWDLAAAGV